MRKVFILLNICLSIMIYAQKINLLPPSPSSAQIIKYTETPVNLANGIPEITIPLFSFKEDDIEVPIELKYHAGGIKVEELASEVGIGWVLNAGGRISRVMRGRPDDSSRVGFMYNESIVNQTNPFNFVARNDMDVEADLYHFNFLNYSGSFAYDKDKGNFVQFPLSDLKITPRIRDKKIKGFIITDEKGTEYYFGLSKDNREAVDVYIDETSYTDSPMQLLDDIFTTSYINTWHLTEIISKKGKIEFYYGENFPTEQLIRASQKISYSDTHSKYSNFNPSTTYIETQGSDTFLERIESQNGLIVLEYSKEEREDYKGGRSLVRVMMKSKYSEDDYQSYVFDYGYMRSLLIKSLPINKPDELYYTKRLRLDRLSIVNHKSGTEYHQGNYQFTYSKINLPDRYSYDQDYWGYYNGASNESLIPPYFFGLTRIEPNTGGATRSVNPNFSHAGTLIKIQYPTGGSVSYEYESNTVNNHFSPNIQNYSKDVSEAFAKSNAYKVDNGVYKKQITINNAIWNKGKIRLISNISNCGELTSLDCDFMVSLINNENKKEIIITNGDENIDIPNGTYTLVAEEINSENKDSDFFVRLTWKEDVDSVFYAGGLRVKSITLEDLSGKKIEKKYNYDSDDFIAGTNRHKTSGETPTKLKFRSNMCYDRHLVYNVNSNSNYPSINVGTGAVQYLKVTEVIENKSKTEYYFDYIGDINSPIVKSGYQCSEGDDDYFKELRDTYFTTRRGKLLKKQDFKWNKDGSFSMIKKEENTYKEDRYYVIRNFSTKYDIGVSGYGDRPVRYYVFSQRTNFHYLAEKTIEEYFDHILKTQVTYKYTNQNHYQITTHNITQPDKSVQTTSYQYAHEKGNDYLINKNIVGIPLETIVTQDGKIISKTETIYPTSQAEANIKTQGLPLHVSSLSYDLENPTKTNQDITYTQYDNKGNLLEYKLNGITPVVIIWGYHQTLPIAKIEGATYDQVKNLVSDIISKSNEDKDEVSEKDLITALDNFRNKEELKNFQITTYTHNPLIGVTSITPPSGIREIYKYDDANRLTQVLDIEGNILKEYNYHYSEPYKNIIQSKTFTRNYCPNGYIGDDYNYIVPAGKYISLISQDDADQKALDDIKKNGQKEANIHASCKKIYYNSKRGEYFDRQNCNELGADFISPKKYYYEVPAGKYISLISQDDADQKALDDIKKNGQKEANLNAECVYKCNFTPITNYYYNFKSDYMNVYLTKNNKIKLGLGLMPGHEHLDWTQEVTIGKLPRICSVNSTPNATDHDFEEYIVPIHGMNNINWIARIKNNGDISLQIEDYNKLANSQYKRIFHNNPDRSRNNTTFLVFEWDKNVRGSHKTTFYNTIQSKQFLRNNCPVGYKSESYTYTVPSGKYYSTISQEDADQKALDDINKNGQKEANLNAKCVPDICSFTPIKSDYFDFIKLSKNLSKEGNKIKLIIGLIPKSKYLNWNEEIVIGKLESCIPTTEVEDVIPILKGNVRDKDRRWIIRIKTTGEVSLQISDYDAYDLYHSRDFHNEGNTNINRRMVVYEFNIN